MKLKIDLKPLIPVLVAVSFMAAAAGLIFVSFMFWNKVGVNRAQTEKYVQENEFIRGILGSTRLEPVAVGLVDRAQSSMVTDAIIRTAQKNRVEIGIIKPDKRKPEGRSGYDRIFFTMTATAGFRELGAFFEGVRNLSEGVVEVVSLSMVMSKEDPKQVNADIVWAVCVSK